MKKRVMIASVGLAIVGLLATAALAQMGGGPWWGHSAGPGMMGTDWGWCAQWQGPGQRFGGWGMGPGMMGPGTAGPGMMGPGMMGPGTMGPGFRPDASGTVEPITADRAKVLAQEYVDQYLAGYTVDIVLPVTTPMGLTMFSVELKSSNGEGRILHVSPWGNVMPFGGAYRRAG